LEEITRVRFGTSVNVCCAVRCDHSEETSRVPITGRRFTDGCIAASSIVSNVWSDVSPNPTRIPAIASVSATTAHWSQKPARVSVILRSSTSVRRTSEGRASRPASGAVR